jgi:hypothetical protein
MAMVQTICQSYKGFTKHKVRDAIIACKGQATTGHSSNAQFQAIVKSNTIKNFPIKPKHIANANSIFSPSIAGVRGKTILCKPSQVEAAPGCIPDNFHPLRKFVVLTRIAFLTNLLQKLRLATVEQLPPRTAQQLNTSLSKIFWLYACTGFIIKVVMMDQEFDKIEDKIKLVEINTTTACKHVGKIKHTIQTIKEHSQALLSDLPYSILPQQVVIHLVYFAVLWLNSLPAAAGYQKFTPLATSSLAASLTSPNTVLHPLALSLRLTKTQQSQIPCVSTLSWEYSSAPRGTVRRPTRF